MSISRWEPFRDMMALREAMDRLFEDNYVRTGPRWTASGEVHCSLPIDAYVTDEEIVISAVVPGVDPEKVDITIDGDTLTIKGEVPRPLENVNYIAQERAYGKFQRTLQLNVPVQADKIEATFERGILTLVLPKKEEMKPRQIKVTAK